MNLGCVCRLRTGDVVPGLNIELLLLSLIYNLGRPDGPVSSCLRRSGVSCVGNRVWFPSTVLFRLPSRLCFFVLKPDVKSTSKDRNICRRPGYRRPWTVRKVQLSWPPSEGPTYIAVCKCVIDCPYWPPVSDVIDARLWYSTFYELVFGLYDYDIHMNVIIIVPMAKHVSLHCRAYPCVSLRCDGAPWCQIISGIGCWTTDVESTLGIDLNSQPGSPK